ncbi:PepSY domain-containing protein [Rariglobus hedericola]|nr:PepSY domain-containing protein [Rariglobus hedericola]
MALSPSVIRRLHRWIGLTCALTVMIASGSGVIHMVMTWTQSPPPRPQPGDRINATAVQVTPADALARLGRSDAAVQSMSLRMIGGQPWYQMLVAGSPVPLYVNAVDGHEDPDTDATYAKEIATRYVGGSPVKWVRRMDSFDGEYIVIFRMLPVHRIEVEDGRGTRLYVSTLTGSVARHTDNRRQFEANIFTYFHKYAFISSKPWRDGVLVGFTSLAFLASLSGIVLFFATARRRVS